MQFQTHATALCFLLTSIGSFSGAEDIASVVGLVTSKPAEGRFVETNKGFMVPYSVTMPGTDVTFEMVPIPGGETTIGSPDDEEGRSEDEGTQIKVTFAPFWMAKCEVSWAEYKHFMGTYDIFKAFESAGIRQVTEDRIVDTITSPTPLYEPDTTYALGEEPMQPAVTMSQYAARQYARWMTGITGCGYRLPTEFEWEHACRAGTTGPFSFGDGEDIGEYAWYAGNSDDAYHEVGEKKPNAWGLHDMHGNVGELCLDQYAEDAYGKFSGKTVDAWDAINWPTKMFPHVVRGGGWDADAERLRSAARSQTEDWREEDPNIPKSPWWFTDEPAQAVGFRLIRTLEMPTDEQQLRLTTEDSPPLKMAVEFRLDEGRGIRALVDKDLPKAIEESQ